MSEEKQFSNEDINKLLTGLGEATSKQPQEIEQEYKVLQLAHLSVKMMLDERHIESMSSLTEAERNDFADADYLNAHIFNDPMYDTFKQSYLRLSRSVSSQQNRTSFIDGFFSMLKSSQAQDEEKGVLSRILGR